MSFTRTVIENGNGQDKPKPGDVVTIEYTGWIYDENKAGNDCRGEQFDSSVGRGDFKFKIGAQSLEVVKGFDAGVLEMSLGEKSALTIPADSAYGDRGFPGMIPPNSDIIFEVTIKGINENKI